MLTLVVRFVSTLTFNFSLVKSFMCNLIYPGCPTGAPAIDLPPEYLDVVQYKAGASVKLKIGIIAKPLPMIEWLKDGKELVATSTMSVENTTDTSAVLIKDAARHHTGSYEVRIKNVLGTASATIRIEILGINAFFFYYTVCLV